MKSRRLLSLFMFKLLTVLLVISINRLQDTVPSIKSEKKHLTTVVSIFFSLNKSKHQSHEYNKWLQTFLKSVKSPLAIVCDVQSLDKIREYSRNVSFIKLYVYESIWDAMRVLEEDRNMSYVDNYRNEQMKLDPESHIHNPDLYAIWNLKTFIMKFVSDENPFNSDYFIYTDAGAWRGRVYEDWPDEDFIHDLMKVQQNRILFGQISKSFLNLEHDDVIEGTFFSGNKQAFDDLFKNYYSIHDRRLAENRFVGKDQILMNILAFKEHNQTVIKLRTWNTNCEIDYDPWFFYQNFFPQKTI